MHHVCVFKFDWVTLLSDFTSAVSLPLLLRLPSVVWNPQCVTEVLTEAVTSPCPACSGSTGRTTPSSPSTRGTGGFIPCSPSTSCTLASSGRSGSGYKTTWPSRSRRTRPPPACSVRQTSLPVYNHTSSELCQLLNGKARGKKTEVRKSVKWKCEFNMMHCVFCEVEKPKQACVHAETMFIDYWLVDD